MFFGLLVVGFVVVSRVDGFCVQALERRVVYSSVLWASTSMVRGSLWG
jgi:hypothetical protein